MASFRAQNSLNVAAKIVNLGAFLEHSNAEAGNGINLSLKDEKQADILQIYAFVL